jgi:hypothetical protein
MSRYANLSAGLLGAWFVSSLMASALHLFRTGPEQPPLAVGLAPGTPIAAFLVWFAASPRFREYTLSLNPLLLTLAQTWRVGGFVFLALATRGVLPWLFALPAGFGDMAVGFTAPLVAMRFANPQRRRRFVVWQLFGMADLVTAVSLGTLAGVIAPHGVSTTAMTVLPMSMIPTFAVPLLFILHIICLAQAMRWPAQSLAETAQPICAPAA